VTAPSRLQDVPKTGGDSRGLEGATNSTENQALATKASRHRSFLKTLEAGSIPAASTIPYFWGRRAPIGRALDSPGNRGARPNIPEPVS